jgi:aconitate hydratase
MGRSVARKLLESHLVEGDLAPGSEIAIRIGETLTQDATGTLVMLELEAMASTACGPNCRRNTWTTT